MGFAVGETVGPYTITAFVAQGGMATIFRAHHAALDRDVALKVIHPALREDKTFLARLQREASIIAKLNHPNIVTVYDFSEFDGTPFLALQYVDGKTLKEVLRARKLETSQILEIVRPVAAALTYAHAQGVLHRDVKPSNILIDRDGHVYLTDFGLARLAQSSESTLSHEMLIGSPQYISPEQAKAEGVDVRTDVYSLGVVLYEMFTGRVPFAGDTPYATVIAQINEPPPAARSLNPKIRPAVEQVLRKALAKDPNQRYASVREMMHALENAAQGPREQGAALAAPPRAGAGRKPSHLPWIPLVLALGALILLFACLAGGAFLAWQAQNQSGGGPTRAAVVITGTTTPVGAGTARAPLLATATPSRPVASPTREGATQAPGLSAPRGKIAYSVAVGELAEQHSIWIADADGTDARQLIEIANWPALAPDGKQIAYHRIKDEGIYVANIDGGNPRRIVGGETCCVQWAPDSKRVTFLQGKLKAGDTKIMLANADGTGIAEITTGFNPTWSPDGARLAYAGCQPNSTQCGLFVLDLKTKAATMLTRDNGGNPQWSPRGDRIVYHADDGKGHINVFVANSDGSGVKQLTAGKSNDGQPTWSLDGNFIFWRSDQNGTGWAIFVMRADGSNPRLLIKAAPDGNLWARESLSAGP